MIGMKENPERFIADFPIATGLSRADMQMDASQFEALSWPKLPLGIVVVCSLDDERAG